MSFSRLAIFNESRVPLLVNIGNEPLSKTLGNGPEESIPCLEMLTCTTAEWHTLEGTYLDPAVGEMVRGALVPSPRLEAPFSQPHPTASTWHSHS